MAASAQAEEALANWEPRTQVAAEGNRPAAPAEVASRHSREVTGNREVTDSQAAEDSRGAIDIPVAVGANLEAQGCQAAHPLAKASSREDRRPLAWSKVPESNSNLQERTEGLSCDSVCR